MALCRFCLSCLFGGLNSRNLISTLKGVDNLLFLAFGRSSPMLSWYHGRAWGSKGEMFIQIYIYIYIYIEIYTHTQNEPHLRKTARLYITRRQPLEPCKNRKQASESRISTCTYPEPYVGLRIPFETFMRSSTAAGPKSNASQT